MEHKTIGARRIDPTEINQLDRDDGRHTGRMSSKRHAISTEITNERWATALGPTESKLFFFFFFFF